MGFSPADMLADLAPKATATTPKTDLSPHVDGGQSATTAVSQSSMDNQSVLYGGVAVVAIALALLWFFGAFAFRGLPSL